MLYQSFKHKISETLNCTRNECVKGMLLKIKSPVTPLSRTAYLGIYQALKDAHLKDGIFQKIVAGNVIVFKKYK